MLKVSRCLRLVGLTERQAQVAELVWRGCSNKEIGKALKITVNTVKNHLTLVFSKIEVEGRLRLAIWIGRRKHETGESDAVEGAETHEEDDPEEDLAPARVPERPAVAPAVDASTEPHEPPEILPSTSGLATFVRTVGQLDFNQRDRETAWL